MFSSTNKVAPIHAASSVRGNLAAQQVSSVLTCRICLQQSTRPQFTEQPQSPDDMISPCECTGSVGYVHVKCMRMWIQKQMYKNKMKRAYCQICRATITYKTERFFYWNCKRQNLNDISNCNIASLIAELVLLSMVVALYIYLPSLIVSPFLGYILTTLVAALSISILLTIFMMVRESCLLQGKKVGSILEKDADREQMSQFRSQVSHISMVSGISRRSRLGRRTRRDNTGMNT